MYRIGRDNIIINFNKDTILFDNDAIVMSYGEIDCRCHIQQQINNGRHEDDIIHELVDNYYKTIRTNVVQNVKIIIVGVIPPTKQSEYESIHGPITHEYPFVGDDETRVRFTRKMNTKLEDYAKKNNYVYFNPYDYYTRDDGTLKHELSDTTVHLGNTTHFLDKFYEIIESISISHP